MTQAFPQIETCRDCKHPEGSHVLENKACAVGGCGCKEYLPGGGTMDFSQPATPPAEPTTPAPAPTTDAEPKKFPPLKDERLRKKLDKYRVKGPKLQAATLAMSEQLKDLALLLIKQFVANEVLEFLRAEPGRRVVLTSSDTGSDIEIEAFNPDGTPHGELLEKPTNGD